MVIADVVVCDINGERTADVRIQNGVIAEVGPRLKGEPRINGNGAYLLPGLIDTNVRIKDGQLNGKNLQNLAEEAFGGGVTTVVLAPDCEPAVDNSIVLEFIHTHNTQAKGSRIETALNTVNGEGMLSNIAILLKKGALAPYLTTLADNNLISRIAEYAKMYGVTLHCKAEDESLSGSGVMVEGAQATQLGLGGISVLSEVTHVAQMIEMARHFDISVLFKSIASPRSVAMISQAKKEGVRVSCEVSIHHLLNSDKACKGFNTTAKIDPPLAVEKDAALLREALKSGEIDMLTSLHQPNSPVNKEVAFFDASYGCEAIADALPLYYTKLVEGGMVSMAELVRMTAYNPAASVGRKSGLIEPGVPAELILFETESEYTVENSQSLYNGQSLHGKVVMAICGGEIVRR